jgi:hypothetical protein
MRKLTTTALLALALTACAEPPEPARSPEHTRADLTELLMPATQPQPPAECLPVEAVMGWNGCPR